ncbi:hypothetical protein HanIR_Chr12g0561811 [Helianthus annuus]|nr:hypothetical protein HanIR_Chr12g0561811 [Helianthus annuus]
MSLCQKARTVSPHLSVTYPKPNHPQFPKQFKSTQTVLKSDPTKIYRPNENKKQPPPPITRFFFLSISQAKHSQTVPLEQSSTLYTQPDPPASSQCPNIKPAHTRRTLNDINNSTTNMTLNCRCIRQLKHRPVKQNAAPETTELDSKPKTTN